MFLLYGIVFYTAKWLITLSTNKLEKFTNIEFKKNYSIIESIVVTCIFVFFKAEVNIWINIVTVILIANLTVMTEMDYKYKVVYDLYHYISTVCLIMLLCYFGLPENYLDLGIFILLQMLIFGKMYGEADAIVFCLCAVYMSFFNAELLDFLIFMLLSIFILGIMQAFKKNISKNGKLKHPVAYTPYILVSFLFFI